MAKACLFMPINVTIDGCPLMLPLMACVNTFTYVIISIQVVTLITMQSNKNTATDVVFDELYYYTHKLKKRTIFSPRANAKQSVPVDFILVIIELFR